MEQQSYYESKKRYQLTPVQQQIYTDLLQMNAHIENINSYLELGHLDHALHTFHLMLNIYKRLDEAEIPFIGKEIVYEKIMNIRKKIKRSFL